MMARMLLGDWVNTEENGAKSRRGSMTEPEGPDKAYLCRGMPAASTPLVPSVGRQLKVPWVLETRVWLTWVTLG